MSTLTVHFRGMSGSVDVELPEDSANLAAAREQAGIGDNLGLAINGERVAREAEADTPVANEQTVSTLPPDVKAG